ncbi:hypothetical protein B7486_51795, partial [cyanobacterium TDX16]
MARAAEGHGRSAGWRRWSRLAAALVLLAVATSCGGGPEGGTLFPVDRGSTVDAVVLDVVVGEDGNALMTVRATFADSDQTDFPTPAGGTPIDEPMVDGDRTTAGFALSGVADAASDITTIELPTYTSPADASRQDPEVEVSGTVSLPEGAGEGLQVQWTNGFDADVAVEGDTIRFSGQNPAWTDAELLVGGPPGMLAGLPASDRSGQVAFQTAVAQSESQTASLESTLDSQEQQQELIGWVIVGVGVGVSVLMAFQFLRLNTADARFRRRQAKAFPKYVLEPPDELSPALVDLVDADGKRVEAEAVAGTLLDLAHRRVLGIDGYADGRFVLRLPATSAVPAGLTASERTLVEGLRATHPDGEVAGPPTWPSGKPSWWGAYRREVLKEGRDAGVIQRRLKVLYFGPFVAGIVAATWPWWAGDRIWLVPTLCIALGLVTIIPLKGGFSTTHRGFTAACRWRGFARYVRDHGELRDLGPAAVQVWGPYLAYSAVLGEAPAAAEALAPEGLPERTTRAERRAADDEADLAVDGPV